MDNKQLMEHLKQVSASEQEVAIELMRVLYQYANHISCLGVVLQRFSNINMDRIKVKLTEEEPLHVYEGEEEESVRVTYFAPVITDSLKITNEQLNELFVTLQRLELVKCFVLDKLTDGGEYSLRSEQGMNNFVADGQICVYALTSQAVELLEE